MSFFLNSPEEARALSMAHARRAAGVPTAAAALLDDADRNEALGMPRSAATLRELAAVRQERREVAANDDRVPV